MHNVFIRPTSFPCSEPDLVKRVATVFFSVVPLFLIDIQRDLDKDHLMLKVTESFSTTSINITILICKTDRIIFIFASFCVFLCTLFMAAILN